MNEGAVEDYLSELICERNTSINDIETIINLIYKDNENNSRLSSRLFEVLKLRCQIDCLNIKNCENSLILIDLPYYKLLQNNIDICECLLCSCIEILEISLKCLNVQQALKVLHPLIQVYLNSEHLLLVKYGLILMKILYCNYNIEELTLNDQLTLIFSWEENLQSVMCINDTLVPKNRCQILCEIIWYLRTYLIKNEDWMRLTDKLLTFFMKKKDITNHNEEYLTLLVNEERPYEQINSLVESILQYSFDTQFLINMIQSSISIFKYICVNKIISVISDVPYSLGKLDESTLFKDPLLKNYKNECKNWSENTENCLKVLVNSNYTELDEQLLCAIIPCLIHDNVENKIRKLAKQFMKKIGGNESIMSKKWSKLLPILLERMKQNDWKDNPMTIYLVIWCIENTIKIPLKDFPFIISILVSIIQHHKNDVKCLGMNTVRKLLKRVAPSILREYRDILVHVLDSCLSIRNIHVENFLLPLLTEIVILLYGPRNLNMPTIVLNVFKRFIEQIDYMVLSAKDDTHQHLEIFLSELKYWLEFLHIITLKYATRLLPLLWGIILRYSMKSELQYSALSCLLVWCNSTQNIIITNHRSQWIEIWTSLKELKNYEKKNYDLIILLEHKIQQN